MEIKEISQKFEENSNNIAQLSTSFDTLKTSLTNIKSSVDSIKIMVKELLTQREINLGSQNPNMPIPLKAVEKPYGLKYDPGILAKELNPHYVVLYADSPQLFLRIKTVESSTLKQMRKLIKAYAPTK